MFAFSVQGNSRKEVTKTTHSALIPFQSIRYCRTNDDGWQQVTIQSRGECFGNVGETQFPNPNINVKLKYQNTTDRQMMALRFAQCSALFSVRWQNRNSTVSLWVMVNRY